MLIRYYALLILYDIVDTATYIRYAMLALRLYITLRRPLRCHERKTWLEEG